MAKKVFFSPLDIALKTSKFIHLGPNTLHLRTVKENQLILQNM